MKGFSKIIDKTESVGIISGVDFDFDTKGLNCVFKVVGGSMGVKPYGTNDGLFVLENGDEIDLCGKVTFRFVSGTPSLYCLYYHVV